MGYKYGVRPIWESHPASIDILRECVALRMSAAEAVEKISAALNIEGLTRNTVIGKASRLGIKFNSENNHNTFAKHGQGKARPSRAAAARAAPKPIKIAIAAPVKIEPPHGRGLLITELARRDCRYPTGIDEDGRHLFCGEEFSEATLDNGRCYCAGHSYVAYRPAPTRKITPEHRRALLAGKTRAARQREASWSD